MNQPYVQFWLTRCDIVRLQNGRHITRQIRKIRPEIWFYQRKFSWIFTRRMKFHMRSYVICVITITWSPSCVALTLLLQDRTFSPKIVNKASTHNHSVSTLHHPCVARPSQMSCQLNLLSSITIYPHMCNCYKAGTHNHSVSALHHSCVARPWQMSCQLNLFSSSTIYLHMCIRYTADTHNHTIRTLCCSRSASSGVIFSRNSISIILIFFKAYIDIIKVIPEYSTINVYCVRVEWIFFLFSDILKRNNDCSDTLDFIRG